MNFFQLAYWLAGHMAHLVASTVDSVKSSKKPVSRASATGKNTPAVQEGQLIEHERFGRGTVLRVEGAGENAKATIRFENVGEKQLLLRFARFKVL